MSGGLGVSGAESMIPPWRFIKQQSKNLSSAEQCHHQQTQHCNEFSLQASTLALQINLLINPQSGQIGTKAFSYSTYKKTEQIGRMIPYGARSWSRDKNIFNATFLSALLFYTRFSCILVIR
jgi:hypothetical protein